MPQNQDNQTLTAKQSQFFHNPQKNIQEDFKNIYEKNNIILGWQKGQKPINRDLVRKNTAGIVGVALGDEGKGRFVDNTIEEMLQKPGVKEIYVIRYQGGNNAGHTVEKGNIKLALHLVPSGVFYEQAIGIMDRGMVIHIEDLQTEVNYVEEKVGSLQNRLFLSDEAIHCTDLERAEEILNRQKSGEAKGGTGRGISPSYAHNIDRLGLKIFDLLSSNWEMILGRQYERYEKEFKAFGMDLTDIEIADFRGTVQSGKEKKRTVGSKEVFIKRLREARKWLLKRNFITNTFLIHNNIFSDTKKAVLFEGAQSAGLDSWVGTRPDVTSSNTTLYGVREGTAYWLAHHIEERIGLLKVPYTSSVGQRLMTTYIDIPKGDEKMSPEQKWAARIRERAHEYGTTTGRPRDINYLDLAFINYNIRMSGIDVLAGTHLDVVESNETIKVCTRYVNKKGDYIPYQPGLRYQEQVIPQYVELPSWDGAACTKAKHWQDLPENAQKFLAFIQARTGYPIVAVTTGAKRANILKLA